MFIQFFKVVVVLFALFTSACNADEWRSKDGRISLTQPHPERFTEGKSTPPMSAIWVSTDESLKLGVIELDNKQRFKIDRRSMETAFAKEFGGTITESSTKEISGLPTYTMTAVGKLGNVDIEAKQLVVEFSDKLYKVLAIGVGAKVEGVEDIKALFASLRIHAEQTSETPQTKTNSSESSSKNTLDDTEKVNSISGKVGAWGVLLLVALGILRWVRSPKRRGENVARDA